MIKTILASLLAVSAICAPAFAMGTRAVDQGTMPVSAADWNAAQADHDRAFAAFRAKATAPMPELGAVTSAFGSAMNAKNANNNAEFQRYRDQHRAAIATLCAKLGGC